MSAGLVLWASALSFGAYIAVALGLRARARRSRPASVAEEGGVARWLPAFVWVPYLVLALRPGPEVDVPEALRWLGLVLVVAGPVLAMWAAISLGRDFDMEVEVHGGHRVVRAGPYGRVRHPIYAALAVHFLGAGLASGNALFIAGTLLGALPAFYLRARAEEALLREQLGDEYARYAREVPMFVPTPR